ncbi:MAG: RDD family protein [Bdellovibrionaceae bacterium]|nr:RDD family protein [Pseudobdellovibrionaceae bacterium]
MYYFPSTWRRLFAHFLDKAYIMLLQSPVLISVCIDFLKSEVLRIHWSHLLYMVLVSVLYETLSLYFYSTTLGKWQWGLRIISREGGLEKRNLNFEEAITRVLVSRLSFFFGWSIFALAFFKVNRTHLADWVANTQVVSTNKRPSVPEIRWILGLGFILLFCGESLRTASMTLYSARWRQPYFYFQNQDVMQMLKEIEASMDAED